VLVCSLTGGGAELLQSRAEVQGTMVHATTRTRKLNTQISGTDAHTKNE
jgi:hypothetical protein